MYRESNVGNAVAILTISKKKASSNSSRLYDVKGVDLHSKWDRKRIKGIRDWMIYERLY